MNVQELLAMNMKRLRKLNSMTQADLSEKSGVSTTFIAEIEITRKFPSPQNLEKLANALKVEPFELLMPENVEITFEDKKRYSKKITEKMRNLLDEIDNDLYESEV